MTKRQLVEALEKAREGRRRARLTAELKSAVGAYCAERRTVGARWAQLSAELKVCESQLQQWAGGSPQGSKLRRVHVVATPAQTTGLCLELPGSARVTGLSIADVAALLRELR